MSAYQMLIDPVCHLACEAGEKIMGYYGQESLAAEQKADNSPVTAADLAAHHHIVEILSHLTPDVPIVSEENNHQPDLSAHESFWLVDPLDGTKSFIRGTGEFTVNIALIEKRVPVFGVIYIPAKNRLFYGSADLGAFKHEPDDYPRKICARVQPEEGVSVVVSHSHLTPETEDFLRQVTVADRVSAASSLKFCVVAEGKADLYPRFGRTMEWDTAAGHAILLAAGGQVLTPEGTPLFYGKTDFANGYFIASGKGATVSA